MKQEYRLIVISGIAGDAYSAPQNTWTNQLHQQFPHALVNKYRFSQSSVRHGLHGFDLKREARFIRDQLLSSNNEDDGAGNLPIIFIARDLGVSLAKQVILLFHEDGISTKLQDRIKALFTFDTLHPAADAVRWKHYLDQLLKKYYRHSPLLSHFLSDLPETLQKIEAEFVSVSFSLKVFGLEMDIQGRNYEESTGNVPNLPWYLRFGESMLDFLCNKFSLLVMETSRGYQNGLERFAQKLSRIDSVTYQVTQLPSLDSITRNLVIEKEPSVDEWVTKESSRILYVHGHRGSPLMTFANRALNLQLERQGNAPVIVLIFSFLEQNIAARDPMCLLVSLCRQLLAYQPSVFKHVSSICEFMANNNLFTLDTIRSVLFSTLENLPNRPIYCVIYGIHECKGPAGEIIKIIDGLSSIRGSSLKAILTSYDSLGPGIVSQPAPLTGILEIQLSEYVEKMGGASLARSFVTSKIDERPLWAELRTEIEATLFDEPTSYLLTMHKIASLEFANIRHTKSEFRKQLNQLPKDLPGVAEYQKNGWVHAAFQWVVGAFRPLSKAELAVAVVLDRFTSESDCVLTEIVSEDIIGDLRRFIGPLFVETGDHVFLADEVLQDLFSSENKDFNTINEVLCEDLHFYLFERCLYFFEHLAAGRFESEEISFTLKDYASRNWHQHYQQVMEKHQHQARHRLSKFLGKECHLKLLDTGSKSCAAILAPGIDVEVFNTRLGAICSLGLLELLGDANVCAKSMPNYELQLGNSLDIAAYAGHYRIVERLLKYNAKSRNALKLAAVGNHPDIINELVEADASMLQNEDSNGFTALHHAACRGCERSVETLIECQAPINAQTHDGNSPLSLAIRAGQATVADMLIKNGANLAVVDNNKFGVLHFAAQAGLSEIVDCCLQRRVDVHMPTDEGETALTFAIQYGHTDIVEILLPHYKDSSIEESKGFLHIAATEGQYSIVEALLRGIPNTRYEYRQSIHEESSVATTALQLAASKGHADIVQLLLDKSETSIENRTIALSFAIQQGLAAVVSRLLAKSTLNQYDDFGNTLLHKAAECSNIRVLSLLLDTGKFDINTENDEGFTALHKAAQKGNSHAIVPLIANKANVNKHTKENQTPLEIATQEGHVIIVQELMQLKEVQWEAEPLFKLALRNNHVDVAVEILHQASFPSSLACTVLRNQNILESVLEAPWFRVTGTIEKDYGNSILHLAVIEELENAVKLLLQKGADPCKENSKHEIPLHIAALKNRADIVRLLLDYESGLQINARDKDGNTPLFIASWNGNVEVVKELISMKRDVKCDVNSSNTRGWNPLHASYDNLEITDMLLKADADPNLVTKLSKSTALSMAANNDDWVDVVRLHLEKNANPGSRNMDGETAIHRAVLGGSFEVVKLLVEDPYKTNINAKRLDKCTPLHLAAHRSEAEIVQYLLSKQADRTILSEPYGTALMAAACSGSTEVAKLLFEDGEDVNAVRGPYDTILNAATYHGNIDMVKWLIKEKDADVNVTGDNYGNALCAAIIGTGDNIEDIVACLLEHDKDNLSVNYLCSNGSSILRLAVEHKRAGVIGILTQHGANTRGERDGKEPLAFVAVENGDIGVLEVLLRLPDTLSSRDQYGRSLLSAAIGSGGGQIVRFLLTRGGINLDLDAGDHARRTPLIFAVLHCSGQLEIILQKYKEHGIAIDAQDTEGKTALNHACIMDVESAVHMLLQSRADPTIVDHRGRGPLYWAYRHASLTIIKSISKSLSATNLTEYVSQARLALSAVIATNRLLFIKDIIEDASIDRDQPGPDGWTTLYTAQLYGYSPMEPFLDCISDFEEHPIPELPTKWSDSDKAASLSVSDDGQTITVRENHLVAPIDMWEENSATIRANAPIRPIKECNNGYYYEVNITKSPFSNETCDWGIGFCEEHTSLNLHMGLEKRTWAYHGGDGNIYDQGKSYPFDKTFGTNDTIGCGVSFKNRSIYYTKNGKLIGQAFTDVKGKLYPAVSVLQTMAGAEVSVSFWDTDKEQEFKFNDFGDLRTMEEPERLQQSKSKRKE